MEGKSNGVTSDSSSNDSTILSRFKNKSKQDRLDSFILKIFYPYFLVACALLFFAFVILHHSDTFGEIIYDLSYTFVIGFTILGIFSFILSDKPVISWKIILPIFVLIPLIGSFVLFMFDGSSDIIVSVFRIPDIDLDFTSTMLSVYQMEFVYVFSAFGVVSVVVAYFRQYLYRILRFLETAPPGRSKDLAHWFFQIPDIIDVKEVELEVPDDKKGFDFGLFLNIALSHFFLGIAICSYIFLNPVLMEMIPGETVIIISMFISIFMSPLVIPWSIMKSIGAKVKSQAPRDYYLWKGLRGRLFLGFFTITAFLMLFIISMYLGTDLFSMVAVYFTYSLFLSLISLVTSFIYVNKFYYGFRDGIIKSFYNSKYKK